MFLSQACVLWKPPPFDSNQKSGKQKRGRDTLGRAPFMLQAFTVVAEWATISAAAAIVRFDVVALGARIIVMMDIARSRLS